MASIPPVSSSSSTTAPQDPTVAARVPQKVLGQDDFMKLLAVQFQQQDPMKPMEDTSFIAQMAQFSSLQQTSTMSTKLDALGAGQNLEIANSYLGHHVTVDAGNGAIDSGDVTGVQMVNGAPQLLVNQQSYPVSAVLLVQPGAVTPSTSQPANPGSN